MNKFVLESDGGGQWFVYEWISKDNFHILKEFYSKSKAHEYVDLINYLKDVI